MVSLSSAEAELHALVSAVADGVYIRGCLEFLCGKDVEHYALVDNTAAKQIANKKGVGKIRHLSGKVGKVKVIQIPTKALLYCIGMVDENGGVGETEYEEMAKKHEAGKRIKAMAKTLGRILAASSLERAYGIEFEEEGRCYEIETNEVTENDFVDGASWSMSWSLACMFLAISAVMFFGFMAWKAWKQIKQKVAELQERTQAAEEMARGNSVLSQSLMRRMNDAEWRMDTLWEAVVMIGGFTNRSSGEPLTEEMKLELEIEEDEHRLDYMAGRSAERRALLESSSPNKYDTPRAARGVVADENGANDQQEEEGEDSEEVRYGQPQTEEEPEPHDVTEEVRLEDIDVHDLEGHARRLTALLRREEALLEMAYSQGEFEDADRIERNINHLEGLLLRLPDPS